MLKTPTAVKAEVAGSPRQSAKLPARPLLDSAFLAALAGLSTVLYVGRLGFYSDDWDFLSVLTSAADQTLVGLLREQIGTNLGMRPTQVAYQAVLFRLFGVEPLGYHLVNAGVIMAVAVLLYAVLRRLQLPRILAVAIPAVYTLMPNYATNRFWFAAFGYSLSMALYLVGLYAELRAASSGTARLWAWKAVALTALTGASFGYEVVLPLFLLNVVLAEAVARRRHPGGLRGRLGTVGAVLFHGSTLTVMAPAVVYKAAVAEGLGLGAPLPQYVARLVSGVGAANFGTYGVGLPHTVAWSAPHAGVAGVLLGLAVAAAVYGYLGFARRSGAATDTRTGGALWPILAGTGVAVLVLGYAIFFTTGRISFSSTGIGNRVAAVGALGVAVLFVALLGWMGTRLRSPRAGDRLFRAGIAALCASGVIVTNGLASFWIDSWHTQRSVLAELENAFPRLPADSTVLLDGVCPYIGPAIVFESSWDLRGALRVQHGDTSLSADVTTSAASIGPDGFATRIYKAEMLYPYGDKLLLYDHTTGTAAALTDEEAAVRALGESMEDRGCPPGRPGAGAVALPFDVVFGWVDRRLHG